MRQHRVGWLWPALILLAGAGYQWLVYSTVAGERKGFLGIALAFLPILALAGWIAIRARHKLRWALALSGAAVAVYAIEQHPGWGPAAAYSLPHAAIYLSLLCLFARTLRPGHEPLITRLARRVHGVLPAALNA